MRTMPIDADDERNFFVLCEECKAQGPKNYRQYVDETIAAWNRRAEGQAVQPLPAQSEDLAQLMKFYAVSTLEELARIQAKHIERLQEKLPDAPNGQPSKPRFA
jgi:hypothetical protein